MPRHPALYAAPLGRLLLSGLFLMSAYQKLTNWDATLKSVESAGLVAPQFLLIAATALEILGGLSVLLGIYARLGAVALLVFLVPVTLAMHNYWAREGADQANQMIHFFKNLTILGGVILVLAFGAGPVSFDAWRHRPATGGS